MYMYIVHCYLQAGITWDQGSVSTILPNTASPEACQRHCLDQMDPQCEGATWLTELSPVLPLSCSLFSALGKEEACDNCVSGPPQCFCRSVSSSYRDILASELLAPLRTRIIVFSFFFKQEEKIWREILLKIEKSEAPNTSQNSQNNSYGAKVVTPQRLQIIQGIISVTSKHRSSIW